MTASEATRMRQSLREDLQRVGAIVVDSLIVAALQAGFTNTFGYLRIVNQVVTATLDWPWLLVVLFIAYFMVQEALFGATIGKWLAGLRVVDLHGNRLTPWAALLRNVLRPIDALPAFYVVGAISASVSPTRRRLGDRLAQTTVVDVARVPRARYARAELRLRFLVVGTIAALSLAGYAGFAYYGRPPLVAASYINTADFLWQPGRTRPVTSYSLGPPRWGTGTVMYAIQYVPANSSQTCHATLTLRWAGYFPGSGWELGYGNVDPCAGQEQP